MIPPRRLAPLATAVGGGVLALLLGACSGGGSAREEVLDHLAHEVIVPRYEAAAEHAQALEEALGALCASPSEQTLADARDRWSAAREEWLRSSAGWFGPAMDRRSRPLVSWPVIEPDRIEAALERGGEIGAFEVRETLASSQRGYGAIEYFIFSDDEDDGALLASLPGVRCDYLQAVGEVAADEVTAVRDEWVTGIDGEDGTAYVDVMTGDASVSLSTDAAVEEVVRTGVFLLRAIADTQVGMAMGATGGEPDPAAIPDGPAHVALEDIRTQVLGIRDLYLGATELDAEDTPGISTLVRELSEDSDARVRAAFDEMLAAIDGFDGPLTGETATGPGAEALYQQLKNLQVVIETEVVSLLGVTVGFGDIDGDTG